MYIFLFYNDSYGALQLQFIRSSLRKLKCGVLGLSHLKVISDFKMYSSIYREADEHRCSVFL